MLLFVSTLSKFFNFWEPAVNITVDMPFVEFDFPPDTQVNVAHWIYSEKKRFNEILICTGIWQIIGISAKVLFAQWIDQ